ncbi:Uncharacterised protein [Mycolicibacterium phlei]|uniref:Membrane protein n=1 Tax=Mycolicibacterium phlei DSM 43239 = CCUG 21000 TaxID=1226750 RepID=A0A5N5VGW7_MYCPH|nr:hypothetical protein [Mycolicibacterium phlei]VEG11374.1 Uncharacterised protein [Mycobacteroides chelonae]AMO63277.1 hypothetical protein MPHLCCUG_04491 [Mycolicibacterium phlei]EID16101.1 hypothetical protein MPHLEI_06477 [Mycolicibacterium phlei RIVM601174]KAB7759860.1 membrane protein [Mycolicibacterium phlei DSM 43239 = CCUG 21000]KXW64225.1 membrane protein [Mycolicibacterium phlei DSM 43072]
MTPPVAPGTRPEDVETGFWLWVVALPLMVIGQIVDVFVLGRERHLPAPVLGLSVVFTLIIAAIVLTFLFLMRQGYRWTRTVLTGGGVASAVYAGMNLFGVERPPVAAVTFAVATILGVVLIAGGAFLLHRKDANDFFNR